MRFNFLCLLVIATLAGTALADITQDAGSSLTAMLETLGNDEGLELDGVQVVAPKVLPHIYAGSDNAPIWTNPVTVQHLLDAIAEIANDGLDPADYHQSALVSLGAALPQDPGTLARRDLLLTDAYFAMLYNLAFGKADPYRLDNDWNLDNFYRELDLKDNQTRQQMAEVIRASIVDGDLDSLFNRTRPQFHIYQNLREGLKFYHGLAARGGWPSVDPGPTLREGDTDPRVKVMRQRLILTGDFAGQDTGSNLFDADMTEAVTRYQARHGLTADGVAGKKSIASMNVSATERVDQIRVNLDRSRWVMQDEIGADFVLVNIAAYQAWLVRDHQPIWQTRVQVGKPFTRTPIFTEKMIYLEFNPTWTIPASISNTSTLDHLKQDPNYLATKNMVLLDSNGNKVDPTTVDWNSKTRMPYTVRQEPGPDNALGQVKFIFPNAHAVYLHDTPSKQHFSRSSRAFSHGCIRTENPFELAALLLDDQPKWTPEYIDTVIDSAKQTRVNLSKPLPVFLLYWTAYSLMDGVINFRDDLYDRDAPVLKALNGPLQGQERHRR